MRCGENCAGALVALVLALTWSDPAAALRIKAARSLSLRGTWLQKVAAGVALASAVTLAPAPGLAVVNPMQDVGVGEFLVKDGGQHLRLTLPSPPTVDASADPLRKAQINLELVKLRLEQVGARGPVWAQCSREADQAEKNLDAATGSLVLPADTKTAIVGEIRTLKQLIREENLSAVNAQQVKAAEALAEARQSLLPPKFLPFDPKPPEEFKNLPVLKGRAKVEFVIRHGNAQSKFLLNPGETQEGATAKYSQELPLEVEVDGYHAPITAGNFIRLVSDGFYNNQKIDKAEELIVQTGETNSDKLKSLVPLELFYKRDQEPVYSFTSDEDQRATETFFLPFQAYGAFGMARSPEDADSASSQVFFVKWDQALVPPGRNTLDGFYTCFGYTTKNAMLLKQVEPGDIVVSAKVLSGMENLVGR